MAAMTQDEVDDLVRVLKKHAAAIRLDLDAQDQTAAEIYRYYQMVHRCPEHGAMVACYGALDRWLKQKGLTR